MLARDVPPKWEAKTHWSLFYVAHLCCYHHDNCGVNAFRRLNSWHFQASSHSLYSSLPEPNYVSSWLDCSKETDSDGWACCNFLAVARHCFDLPSDNWDYWHKLEQLERAEPLYMGFDGSQWLFNNRVLDYQVRRTQVRIRVEPAEDGIFDGDLRVYRWHYNIQCVLHTAPTDWIRIRTVNLPGTACVLCSKVQKRERVKRCWNYRSRSRQRNGSNLLECHWHFFRFDNSERPA